MTPAGPARPPVRPRRARPRRELFSHLGTDLPIPPGPSRPPGAAACALSAFGKLDRFLLMNRPEGRPPGAAASSRLGPHPGQGAPSPHLQPPGPRAPAPTLPRTPARRAFTLIELLVVLAILLVVGLIGAGSLQPHLPRYRMLSAAKELRADLARLQDLAVRTGRQTRLRLRPAGSCADPDTWGGAWELAVGDRSRGSARWDLLPEDATADGVDDDASEGTADLGPGGNAQARHVCMEGAAGLIGPGVGNSDSIVFDPRGFLANPSADLPDGYIRVRLLNQAAAREGVVDGVEVVVTAAGFVRLVTDLGADPAPAPVGASTASSAP